MLLYSFFQCTLVRTSSDKGGVSHNEEHTSYSFMHFGFLDSAIIFWENYYLIGF